MMNNSYISELSKTLNTDHEAAVLVSPLLMKIR